MMEPNNIKALIGMLDEPDPELFATLKDSVMALGQEAVPYLEPSGDAYRCLAADKGALWFTRTEDILKELKTEVICTDLRAWKEQAEPDLLQGFYYLSKAFYPELEWNTVCEHFNRLHGDCWLLLATADTLQDSLIRFNNFFFNQARFHLGKSMVKDYGFEDFLLPNLINLNQGNERSLALAYQYLAHRNKIPVYLLNLPVINLLACTTDMDRTAKDDVRYCIDIMQRGALVSRHDVEPTFSLQKQIRISDNVEALQDYAKLMFFMISAHDNDASRKECARKLYQALGDSPSRFTFEMGAPDMSDLPGAPDTEDNDEDEDDD